MSDTIDFRSAYEDQKEVVAKLRRDNAELLTKLGHFQMLAADADGHERQRVEDKATMEDLKKEIRQLRARLGKGK